MECTKIPFAQTGLFAPIFLDLISEKSALKPFYHRSPSLAAFWEQIREKQREQFPRKDLVSVLEAQYAHLPEPPHGQIASLGDERTFTVTTGHQLNIYGGPLYFMYKIMTVIRLAEQLKAAYPDYHFVPVYWMATEDHDFEEISTVNVFGTTYRWEAEQAGGPVGKMPPTGLESLLESVNGLPDFVPDAYRQAPTLADAVRRYVHAIFGEYGLLCLDADEPLLKKHFATVMERELLDTFSATPVREADTALEALGYHSQIHARDINLFYLGEGLRKRIVKEDGKYHILDTDWVFDTAEIKELVHEKPENFSPNVVLRPLYQEMILPNLSYTGGPAEMAYWLQLKGLFEEAKVTYPILLPRNFAMIVRGGQRKKLEKLELKDEDLFKTADALKEAYISSWGKETSLDQARNIFQSLQKELENHAKQIDSSLIGWIGSEMSKTAKSIDHIEKRLRKAEEKSHETVLKQIEALKYKLFPNGIAQERHDNFLEYYINTPNFIPKMMELFDPFDFQMYLIKD